MNVIHIGLGPIGQRVVTMLRERDGIHLVAAVDIDPAKSGRDVGEICGGAPCGVPVTSDLVSALSLPAQAVILTTQSRLVDAAPALLSCVSAGRHVVSTCEELAYPWRRSPDLARQIDEAARAANVAVLGTGVNPGFVMDALPLFLTGVCSEVRGLRIERHQNASLRRLPFQNKVGAGLTLAEFARRRERGAIGHVGFLESVHMIGDAIGWTFDDIRETVDPVTRDGTVIGIHQVCTALQQGEPRVTLDLEAYLGHPDPRDTVSMAGTPALSWTAPGGVDGDTATCAITVNALTSILRARPGLRTMLDMPIVTWVRQVRDSESRIGA